LIPSCEKKAAQKETKTSLNARGLEKRIQEKEKFFTYWEIFWNSRPFSGKFFPFIGLDREGAVL